MIRSNPEISSPSLSAHKNQWKNFPSIQYYYLLPPWTTVTNSSKKLWCYIRVWFYFYCRYFTCSWHKTGILHFKWILLWMIVLSDPINHELEPHLQVYSGSHSVKKHINTDEWFVTHLSTTTTMEAGLFLMLPLMLSKQCRKLKVLPTHFAVESSTLCTILYLQDLAKHWYYSYVYTVKHWFPNLIISSTLFLKNKNTQTPI